MLQNAPVLCFSRLVSDSFLGSHPFHVIMPDAPQANCYSHETATESDVIGAVVTEPSIRAFSPTVRQNVGVPIVYPT